VDIKCNKPIWKADGNLTKSRQMPYKENEGKAELGPPAVRANATDL
jgi:hypothetical protein